MHSHSSYGGTVAVLPGLIPQREQFSWTAEGVKPKNIICDKSSIKETETLS